MLFTWNPNLELTEMIEYIISYESFWFNFFLCQFLGLQYPKMHILCQFWRSSHSLLFLFLWNWSLKKFIYILFSIEFLRKKKERRKSFAFDLLKKGHNHKMETDFYEVAFIFRAWSMDISRFRIFFRLLVPRWCEVYSFWEP